MSTNESSSSSWSTKLSSLMKRVRTDSRGAASDSTGTNGGQQQTRQSSKNRIPLSYVELLHEAAISKGTIESRSTAPSKDILDECFSTSEASSSSASASPKVHVDPMASSPTVQAQRTFPHLAEVAAVIRTQREEVELESMMAVTKAATASGVQTTPSLSSATSDVSTSQSNNTTAAARPTSSQSKIRIALKSFYQQFDYLGKTADEGDFELLENVGVPPSFAIRILCARYGLSFEGVEAVKAFSKEEHVLSERAASFDEATAAAGNREEATGGVPPTQNTLDELFGETGGQSPPESTAATCSPASTHQTPQRPADSTIIEPATPSGWSQEDVSKWMAALGPLLPANDFKPQSWNSVTSPGGRFKVASQALTAQSFVFHGRPAVLVHTSRMAFIGEEASQETVTEAAADLLLRDSNRSGIAESRLGAHLFSTGLRPRGRGAPVDSNARGSPTRGLSAASAVPSSSMRDERLSGYRAQPEEDDAALNDLDASYSSLSSSAERRSVCTPVCLSDIEKEDDG